METLKKWAKRITTNHVFELSIIGVILLNCFFIGIETYTTIPAITTCQRIILYIFTIEIILRFIAADSVISFFKGGWNIFDLSLVIVGWIPEDAFGNGSAMLALRVLRVFRVLRLLRTSKEIRLIISVLIKSLSALFYNVIFFFIFEFFLEIFFFFEFFEFFFGIDRHSWSIGTRH